MSPSPPAVPGQPRPRVVISANTTWNIVNFRSNLIRALQRQGYDVYVLSPPDRFAQRLAELGCVWRPLPMDNKGTSPLRDGLLFWRFLRELRAIRPAAFLGYTIKPNVYGLLAAQLLGVPTIPNISGLGTAFIRDSWLTRVVRKLYRVSLARAFRVFFQNEDDRSLFVSMGLVAAGRTALLPGSGVDLDRFTVSDLPSRGEGEAVFLLIARLLRDKGIVEYAEAARQLRPRHPRVKFQLAGMLDVENRTALDAATVEAWVAEGLIEFLGPLDDVRPALSAADCIVLPSYREGTPRTLLEAAASGRPVITTDVPGCREAAVHGATGLLCRVRDAADLAAAMEAMVQMGHEARTALGRAGRAMVEERFDEGLVISAYLTALPETRRAHAPSD